MTDRILEFALRNRALVLLAAFGLLGAGSWSAVHLPIDAVPDITGVQVQVNTEVSALAAEESEKLVTRPIEVELAGLPGVEEMRSLTKFGLSQVTLQFADGTDIYRARQLVAERLQNAIEQLPPRTTPKLAPISTGLGEIFYYNVQYKPDARHKPASEMDQLIELSEIQEYAIKPLLRTVPGIVEINGSGGYEKQYVIQPKPEALEDVGMTFSELAEIIEQNVENAGGGIISRDGQQLTIRAVSRVTTPEEIGNLPIKFGAAVRPLLVKDVAEVSFGTKVRTGAATLNGHETVIGTTLMLAGENGREVGERVKARIAEIQTKLPEGVEIVPQYDRSQLIDRTVATVKNNLFEGAILVVAVLLALLGNWRAALIVATAIPLSFLFALTGMLRGGVSGNLMSLGAVDFGLIIDGAVVIVENIVRQLGSRQHKLGRVLTDQERSAVVLAASKQVGSPMFFGVVIITIVYIPILALSGIEGKMFHPMAITVMLALAGALLLALTLMPVLCSFLLRGKIDEGDNVLMRLAKAAYEPSLRAALKLRWVVVVAAVLLFAGSLLVFGRLGAEFVPKLDEGSITAMLYKPVGMSLEASMQTDIAVETLLLKEFPELNRIFSRIGTSAIASDPMPPNESDVYVFYKPLAEWPKTAGRPTNKAELRERIEAALKEMNPEYDILFAQPIEMRFNEMLEGTKTELSVKIFGTDYDVLETLATQIKAILETTPGAAQVEYETEGRTPQLQIEVKRAALQRYSLQAGEVNKAVSAALGGQIVGSVVDGNRRRSIVVRMPEQLRADDEQIKRLPLRVGETGLIRLGNVVEFKTLKTVEPIRRDDGQRRAALMVNLGGRDVESFVHDAEQRIKERVQLPENYIVEFGGQFKNLQEARTRLAVVVPSALLLIFILIFLAFGSVRQALIVYSGIPLAMTGGVAALWLRGMPFSITAAVGFIALSGVAVLNGLVLVTYFNQLRAQGRTIRDAVLEGSFTRLRPVLVTALVASLGFVPMAIATGAGAEVQRPLATVVIGGVASSTVLTLIVLPVLYWMVHRQENFAGRAT
ncbi:MAG: CusA/CzcA family heavy metal efflux RND transporter [Deltaproteobacteria bacterium]|nr:CusA/CzcA family heavy metal efflux RND transporter [Deltaproteobacteria bacterium]MBI3389250.1 CusA/CzcA family heavy metal efflux RND transporter [Deltaproteobacteria bacterium]